MGLLSVLGVVFKPIAKIVGSQLDGRLRIKEARVNAEISRLNRQLEHEATWEIEAQRNARTSLKDEWWAMLFSLPIAAVFIPALNPYIETGFVSLRDDVPLWYVSLVIVMVLVSHGLRPAGKFLSQAKVWKQGTRPEGPSS